MSEDTINGDFKCSSFNCDKSGAKLQCPKCIKQGLKGIFFCSQECFKNNWKEHKVLHKVDQVATTASTAKDNVYQPWPYYSFTGSLRPYPLTEIRTVPEKIQRPDYATHPGGVSITEEQAKGCNIIKVLDEDEIKGMRLAGKLGREVMDEVAKAVDIGITTDELDRIVHEACIERDCYPSPLNYYQFPKSCCTSVNEVICHGIPDTRQLIDGDILNIDITVYHRGFHGDLNETFLIGSKVDEAAKRLIKVTDECLEKAIALVKPGERYREIGNVIQKHAQANGFSVVRRYCGHGIHRLFHTAPNVPHYAKNKAIGVMKPGHCFTIEPMISEGTWRDILWPDDWTAVTEDGKRSAQFEQTLLVTENGCEILTRRRNAKHRHYYIDQLEVLNK